MRARIPFVFAVFVSFSASATPAQLVVGRVLEEGSNGRVAGANVGLLGTDGNEQGSTVTDSTGRFQLRVAAPGRYSLRVRHVAYVAFTSDPLNLASGQTITVEIRLGRDVIPLRPLVVTARRGNLDKLGGFRERLSTNAFGTFITAEEIERRQATEVSDFFRTMSSVHVVPVKRNANPNGLTTYLIMMRGTGNEPAPEGADREMRGLCTPVVFLDGSPVHQSASFPIDDLLRSNLLGGIEVYTSFASVPAEYQTGLHCGSILLWTREGSGGGKRGWTRHAVGIAGLGLMVMLLR